MRLYYILIAIIPCSWGGQTGTLQEITNIKDPVVCGRFFNYYQELSLYHQFDYYYNKVISSNDDERSLKRAQNYAKKFLKKNHNLADREKWSTARDDIINHYLYFSYTKNITSQDEKLTINFINIYVMMKTYEAAVLFRTCVLYLSSNSPNHEKVKIKLCQEMFQYMEWFFLFMKEEKLKDFCEINSYAGRTKPSTDQFTAKDACERLKKLDLNFLKTQNEVKDIPPLQNDEYNVFKPEILVATNPDTRKSYFKSLFPDDAAVSIYPDNKYLYERIKSRLEFSYTKEFYKIKKYLRAVYVHLPFHYPLYTETLATDQKLYSLLVWHNIHHYKSISQLPVKIPRPIYIRRGDIILRSNAVDILRNLFVNLYKQNRSEAANPLYEKIEHETNSGIPKYSTVRAQEEIGVDYIYTLTEDI